MTRHLTFAEYFAGIGLVRMGLEAAGWRAVFANDVSVKKYEMYKVFFPDAGEHYVVDDIFGVDPACVATTTLATCSFPCIDLSLAGNMNGIVKGRHSSAFWGFTRILQAQGATAPSLILVENVPGWLVSNRGADFRATVHALNELGYACDVFTVNARHFTPQSRLRVFLVGCKIVEPILDIPVRTLQRPKSLLPDNLRQALLANDDLRWFYVDLPTLPPLRTEGLSGIVEQLDDADTRWWSQAEVERHLAMMDKSHYERVERLAQGETVAYRTFFRRRREGMQRAEVRNDDLAGCLRTAVGGSAKQFLVQAGRGKVKMRTMTPREYARLQGVPDSYQITFNGVQALTGFGDAVCVPVISWIGRNVLNQLVDEFSLVHAR